MASTTAPKSKTSSAFKLSRVLTALLPASWVVFCQRLVNTFGVSFLACTCTVYFAQGFRSLSKLYASLWLKDDLKIPADALQSLLSVSAMPWSCKPLYGLLSDARPIAGSHRRAWLRVGAALGTVGWLGLARIASTATATTRTWPLLALLTLTNLSTALSDVVVDAMVAERAAALGRGGGTTRGGDVLSVSEGENALQSACWCALALGGLVGSLVGTVLPSNVPAWPVFFATATCPLLVLISSRWLEEEARPPSDAAAGLRARVVDLVRALRVPRVHRPLAYFFLQNAVVPSCSSVMMFFVTERLGFSSALLSANSVVAYASLLVGSASYARLFGTGDDKKDDDGGGGTRRPAASSSFRTVFFRTQAALAVLSLADLVLVARLNLRLRIPDAPFVLGTDALATLVSRFSMQPFLVMSARLCPKGCEASLFAFFMSTFNLGNTVSGVLGATLMRRMGVSGGDGVELGDGAVDGYAALPRLLAVRTLCMLLPLPLIGYLIPDEGVVAAADENNADGDEKRDDWNNDDEGNVDEMTRSTGKEKDT